MSKYISLFDNWNKVLKSSHGVEEVLEVAKSELNILSKYSSGMYFIQDYRDFGVSYASESVFDVLNYYPENFYERGIELGLELIPSDDLNEVLVLQKRAFDFIQTLPLNQRLSINIRYTARVFPRNSEEYIYIKASIKPIFLDSEGNVVLDVIHWDYAHPEKYAGKFNWSISYYNEEGALLFLEQEEKNESSHRKLTSAEKKILPLLLNGKTSKEIGEELCISRHTVDTHRRNILRKLNFSSVLEMIANRELLENSN